MSNVSARVVVFGVVRVFLSCDWSGTSKMDNCLLVLVDYRRSLAMLDGDCVRAKLDSSSRIAFVAELVSEN